MNVKKLIKKYLKMSFYELVNLAVAKYNSIYNNLFEETNNEKVVESFLSGIVMTCLSIDGKLSEKEWTFLQHYNKNLSYNEALKQIKEYCEKSNIEIIKKEINNYYSLKEELIELCAIIFSVDGEVEEWESSFLVDSIKMKK